LSPAQINADQQAKDANDHVIQANDTLLSRLPYAAARFPNTVKLVVRYLHHSPDPPYTSKHILTGGIDYISFSGGPYNGNYWWSKPRDVAAHEFGHGIGDQAMGHGGNAFGANEVGALHEFLADFMTTVVDTAYLGVNDSATWRIADGLWVASSALNLRSFKNPQFDIFTSDQFMPHLHKNYFPLRYMGDSTLASYYNSTILGHAYYLTIFGGQNEDAASPDIPDITVTALHGDPTTAESRARQIFMLAFMDNTMSSSPTFKRMKTAAMGQALSLYGSAARTTVKNAFEAVGICGETNSVPTAMSLSSIGDLLCAGKFNPTWPLVTGATRYYAEVAPQTFGWAFSTPVTDVDGSTNHCLFQVSQPSLFRIMACNGCGCGPWSQTYSLPYWSPCP
jgi:Thermolysin metallopeptidase, alpha-helical domain